MSWDRILYPLDVLGCNLLGRRFVGAESVGDVLMVGKELKSQGFRVTYNLLGEHLKDSRAVNMAVISTLQLIRLMNFKNCGNVSCKPTLYGLEISKQFFLENIEKIIELAYAKGIETEFDAENYDHIRDTFDVFRSFASQRVYLNSVRQAAQAHLKDIFSLMDEYELWDKNIRIVKGSGVYDEANLLAGKEREEATVERYFEILKRNTGTGREPFVATVRDRKLTESVIEFTEKGGFPFEFQMLYGPMGRKLGKGLLKMGYPVRIYVPFTDSWCKDVWKPYGLRRAKMVRRLLWQELVG